MNVFKRTLGTDKDGAPVTTDKYYVKFRVGGKQVLKCTGHTEERAAKEWARQYANGISTTESAAVLAEKVRAIRSGGETIALAAAIDRFFTLNDTDAGDKVNDQKRSIWADFMAFMAARHPGATSLVDVSETHARAYLKHLRKEGRFQRSIAFRRRASEPLSTYENSARSLSHRSVNLYRDQLRHIFATLAKPAGLAENPFAEIKALKNNSESRDAFTPEELRLIGASADGWLRQLFTLGLYTGLREGDICTLRWDEVDFAANKIVRRMMKTGAEVRIPMLPPVRRLLATLPQQGEYVLPDHAGQYQRNPSAIGQRVSAFLNGLGIVTTKRVKGRTRAASIKDVHSLRHTFVWNAAKHGIPLPIVQSVVGHLSESMTEHYSNHARDLDKQQHFAAMVTEDYFTPAGTTIDATPAPLALPAANAPAGTPTAPTSAADALARIRTRLAAGGPLKALVADIAQIVEVAP